MDLATYAVEARKTAVFDPRYKVTYPALGLVDEAAEFVEKFTQTYYTEEYTYEPLPAEIRNDLISELGDWLWYYSAVCDFADLDISIHFETNADKLFTSTILFVTLGKVAGIAKKSVRDNGGTVNREKLFPIMDTLAGIMNRYCFMLDTTIEEIAEKNITKLRSRQERGVLQGSGDNR